ncbi:MAG: polyketide cyclase, partial [Gammaproteobacteria bacterium]|nr:polyketide cyclase [Gammaproteobacteria bacterium]
MSDIKNIANSFFEACETGKGWQACKDYCIEDASFSSHAEPLLDVKTIEGYSDWMTGVCLMLPDSNYEIKSLTVEEESGHVSFFAVFSGTHTG